jgi:hypothetical protein
VGFFDLQPYYLVDLRVNFKKGETSIVACKSKRLMELIIAQIASAIFLIVAQTTRRRLAVTGGPKIGVRIAVALFPYS